MQSCLEGIILVGNIALNLETVDLLAQFGNDDQSQLSGWAYPAMGLDKIAAVT